MILFNFLLNTKVGLKMSYILKDIYFLNFNKFFGIFLIFFVNLF